MAMVMELYWLREGFLIIVTVAGLVIFTSGVLIGVTDPNPRVHQIKFKIRWATRGSGYYAGASLNFDSGGGSAGWADCKENQNGCSAQSVVEEGRG